MFNDINDLKITETQELSIASGLRAMGEFLAAHVLDSRRKHKSRSSDFDGGIRIGPNLFCQKTIGKYLLFIVFPLRNTLL